MLLLTKLEQFSNLLKIKKAGGTLLAAIPLYDRLMEASKAKS